MIFCTVGTQLPFDRLINYLVDWSTSNKSKKIIYQVGRSEGYPECGDFHCSIQEPVFSEVFNSAKVIVSHAGMGNIIRALDAGKPIVIVPRQSALGEHINDHQSDTADSFKDLPNVFLAHDYERFIAAMTSAFDFNSELSINNRELFRLHSALSGFIES